MATMVCEICGDTMVGREERAEHAREHKNQRRTDAEIAWGYLDGEVLS